MKGIFDPNLLNELLDSAHNPPGGDPVLGAFYTAVVEMVENNEPISQILTNVKKKRPEITYKHLTNLLFRAYQAVKFKEQNLSYQDFNSIPKWRKELTRVSHAKTYRYFRFLLNTRSTTTTIYQRYAGPFAIISYFWDGREVSVADLGCGGNYGLRGIEIREPFQPVKDLTPTRIITELLLKRITIKQGLAIDKENPDSKTIKAWRLACSFYPKELSQLQTIEAFENRIKASQKVKFLQANLLTIKKLPEKTVDIVILSTTLYQLNLQEQLTMLAQAKKLLKSSGLIIVQDFAIKSLANPAHLDFNESWFGKSFSYRTFITGRMTAWKFLEIFQWNNGRCQIVQPGEDFDKIFSA